MLPPVLCSFLAAITVPRVNIEVSSTDDCFLGKILLQILDVKSWPITGASFILLYKNPENKANAAEVIKFFEFAFKDGRKMAEELDYVPMPDVTTEFIRKNVFSKVVTK